MAVIQKMVTGVSKEAEKWVSNVRCCRALESPHLTVWQKSDGRTVLRGPICRPSRRGWSTNAGQRWLGRTDHQSREGLYEVMGVTSDWVAWWLRNS